MQWSHVKCKHSNSFFIATSMFFFFVLILRVLELDYYVFTIFFKLANFIWNIFFVEIYIPMESSNLSLTNIRLSCEKEKEKSYFLTADMRSFFLTFLLVECNYVKMSTCFYGKIKFQLCFLKVINVKSLLVISYRQ